LITSKEVQHVAHLARLELSESEEVKMTQQLNAILEAADKLRALSTDDVPPTAYAVPMQNVFRPDQAGKSLPKDAVLANAPDPEGDFFRVPRIME
jgi:aspartyl-tRNA(Asn)/glutamyl-tRNA(Gln) amidotransferase subunit C